MLLLVLLKLADGGGGSGLAFLVLGIVLGLASVLTLLAVSISWLFEKRTRKRGLIGLGVSLLIIGAIVLAIVL